MTNWISRALPLFNFESLDILFPESNIRVKSYDHSNFSKASAVQFWESRYIMYTNQTSESNVIMTIRISWELPLFNFERLDILCPRIGHPCEKLWPFEFLDRFRCSISSVLIYYAPESDTRVKSWDHLNSGELSLFNSERLDKFCPRIRHPCEKLWPFEFLESLRCSI